MIKTEVYEKALLETVKRGATEISDDDIYGCQMHMPLANIEI